MNAMTWFEKYVESHPIGIQLITISAIGIQLITISASGIQLITISAIWDDTFYDVCLESASGKISSWKSSRKTQPDILFSFPQIFTDKTNVDFSFCVHIARKSSVQFDTYFEKIYHSDSK